MKKKILIIVAVILIFVIGLTGCVEKPFFKGTGTVDYVGLEGGFWAILWDQAPVGFLQLLDVYPPSLPEEYQIDDLRVEFEAVFFPFDLHFIHMVGVPVKIIKIQELIE